MDALKQLGEEASRCAKCGTCLLNCPLYPETFLEQNSSRGKLALIESVTEGDIPFSKRFSQILSQCLICNTCGEGCPNQVKTEEIFLKVRKELCARIGLSLPKKIIFRYLLNSLKLVPAALKTGSFLQGILFKRIPRESGLRLRFPVPFLDRRRLIPALPQKFLKELYSPLIVAPQEKMQVSYFTGCAANYLYPHVGSAAIDILHRHGVSVSIPQEQVCCGLMAFGSGDWKSSRILALKNMEAFEKEERDYIVTTCASCGAALKKYYPMLFEETSEEIRSKVEAFSSRVIDISEFMIKKLMISENPLENTSLHEKSTKIRVTYHDPCHLHRSQGIAKPPRELLSSLPGVEFVEMEHASTCCGMGGSFNITHYDLSLKVLEKKLQALEKCGADILVTGCMGCIIQFMDGIHQKGLNVKVMHLAEMLDKK